VEIAYAFVSMLPGKEPSAKSPRRTAKSRKMR
jgi:hypothetical protein